MLGVTDYTLVAKAASHVVVHIQPKQSFCVTCGELVVGIRCFCRQAHEPGKTAIGRRLSMTMACLIAEQLGKNRITVAAHLKCDGALRDSDASRGEAADSLFGEGRDVESWIDLSPDAAAQLAAKLLGESVGHPAAEVARLLASRFEAVIGVLDRIRSMLNEYGIDCERGMWT